MPTSQLAEKIDEIARNSRGQNPWLQIPQTGCSSGNILSPRQSWDKGEESELLASGTKFRGLP